MDKDTLEQAKDDFKRCHDAESDQRKMSQDDLEFGIEGKQWPETVENDRENEGRPCLTINRMPAFLKQVTNDSRLNRPTITVKPVGSGASQHTASILNDLTRNIWTVSQGDTVVDTAVDFSAAMGFGYMRADIGYTCNDSFDQDIVLRRVANPFSVFGDPDSVEATSIDWNLAFVSEFYSKSRFKAKGWTWEDNAKPASFETEVRDSLWYEDERVRVAEYWTRSEVDTELVKLAQLGPDGKPIPGTEKIMQADEVEKLQDVLAVQGIQVVGTRPTKTYKVRQRLLTAREVLEDNEWVGKYIPIVPMYGEEWNINGKRRFYSLIHRAKDSQRMFNYWRTASTELVALAPKAPYIGPVGAFSTDSAKWSSANTKSHAYIEYDPVGGEPAPQRQPFSGVPAGALQEAMNASDDMKSIIGIFDASLGARSNETSGKAILARQQEGDTSTYNFMDNRNRAVEHLGRIVVDLIPQVYNVPRIMRGIKEDGSTYDVPVNQPVQVQPPQKPGQQEQYKPVQEHIEGLTKIFDLTTGKYDVVVTAGPSFNTKREEAAEQMMEFVRLYPQSAPLIGDLLAKNLDWPGADEIAKRLQAMLPPQAQGQVPPMVQQMQQVIQQGGEQLKQMQQEIQSLQQQLKDKSVENKIRQSEAETKRIGVIVDAAEKGIILTQDAAGTLSVERILPPQQLAPQNGGAPDPVQ